MRELKEELKDLKLAIFDLDGVIYRGDTLIPNNDKIIEDLKNMSIKVVYNSNNSTETREMYVQRLKKLNIPAEISDFYTSASITSAEITKIKENSKVFVIGEVGLKEELKSKCHEILTRADNYLDVDFVIVGLDRKFNYDDLSFAQKCITEGKARFYATNADATLPTSGGFLPGAGVMVKAVEECTSQPPIRIFGKPSPFGIEQILKTMEIDKKSAVMFGDRMNTDIIAGNLAGIKTVLVLTGVTSRKDLEKLQETSGHENSNLFPDLILEDLSGIFKKILSKID